MEVLERTSAWNSPLIGRSKIFRDLYCNPGHWLSFLSSLSYFNSYQGWIVFWRFFVSSPARFTFTGVSSRFFWSSNVSIFCISGDPNWHHNLRKRVCVHMKNNHCSTLSGACILYLYIKMYVLCQIKPFLKKS